MVAAASETAASETADDPSGVPPSGAPASVAGRRGRRGRVRDAAAKVVGGHRLADGVSHGIARPALRSRGGTEAGRRVDGGDGRAPAFDDGDLGEHRSARFDGIVRGASANERERGGEAQYLKTRERPVHSGLLVTSGIDVRGRNRARVGGHRISDMTACEFGGSRSFLTHIDLRREASDGFGGRF